MANASIFLRIGCMAAMSAAISALGESRFAFSQPQMGVPFRIVLYASDDEEARQAAAAAFERIEALNEILSDYEFDSELSSLSRTSGSGKSVPVSEELWNLLSRSQELARRSAGAFDVTVGPSVSLWRRARRKRALPEQELLEKTRARVGFHHLHLNSKARTAKLEIERMRLDLGGIAKGYAADQALEVLKKRGFYRVLVAADGDIRVGDPPPGRDGWRIGIATLDVDEALPGGMAILRNGAISTSGDLSQRLEIDGKRYSHIVDPRTGIGLTDHSLVTVIAPDSTTADSLATTVSVLGPSAGLELIESTLGTAVRIIRQPADKLEIYESKRFEDLAGSNEDMDPRRYE